MLVMEKYNTVYSIVSPSRVSNRLAPKILSDSSLSLSYTSNRNLTGLAGNEVEIHYHIMSPFYPRCFGYLALLGVIAELNSLSLINKSSTFS